MSKRKESDSDLLIHPEHASKRPKAIDDFKEFEEHVKKSLKDLLPTGGRRYARAAILTIDFSVTDIPNVVEIRDELTALLSNDYNWDVHKYTIDCSDHHTKALIKLESKIATFMGRYITADASEASLVCVYFSGHGFNVAGENLGISGAMDRTKDEEEAIPRPPWVKWQQVTHFLNRELPVGNDRLVIMDCCAAGLAHLTHSNVEVLGASAWESEAGASRDNAFTMALIKELRARRGQPVTTTQLISRLYSKPNVRRGVSMPILKRARNGRPPALIHRIEKTPQPPSPSTLQPPKIPRYSHVLIAVKVKKSETVPDRQEWARWLTTNLPSYIGEINIEAQWKTGSSLVVVLVPIEVWLALPLNEAYMFIDYHFEWDAASAARKRREELQEGVPAGEGLGMRSGNIQQGGSAPK